MLIPWISVYTSLSLPISILEQSPVCWGSHSNRKCYPHIQSHGFHEAELFFIQRNREGTKKKLDQQNWMSVSRLWSCLDTTLNLLIIFPSGSITVTLVVSVFPPSGCRSPSPKHGNRTSCLHWFDFRWFATPGAIDFSSILSKTETDRLCEPPEALNSHLGKVRCGNDLGITDMKERDWVSIREITPF